MVTINNTDDFIRALRQNPEFHAAARRELLTEELLALPQRFSQYAESTDKRLDGIDRAINDLKDGQRRLENNVNALRGDALETKMPTRLCDLLSATLDIRRTQIFWMARHAPPPMSRSEQFAQTLEDATDSGTITDDQEGRLIRTDLIVRSVRESDGSRLWAAVEASSVIDQDDISRARQSALALTKIYGEDAIPVVYGYRISDQQREQAAATSELQRVHIFLEHDEASEEQ